MLIFLVVFVVLVVGIGEAKAVTLEELYKQSGVERMPAVVPKGGGSPIPLKRIPVGGVPGIVIGMAAAYIIEKGEDGMDYLRQQAGANAGGDLPTPEGWTDPDSPPLEGDGEIQYREEWTHEHYYPTIQAACVYHAQQYGQAVGNPDTICLDSWTQPSPGYRTRSCPENSSNCLEQTYNSATRLVCSGGYTMSGQGCELYEPADAKWPDDGVPTVSMSNGQFTPHSRDRDSADITDTPSNISVTGTNEDGEPVRIDYTARPDGGLDIRVMTQFNAPDGTTAVNDYRTEINHNGVVQNVVNLHTYNTSLNDYAGPTPSPSTGTGAMEIAIDLPDDYARENTLQNIKTEVTEINEAMKEPPANEPPVVPSEELEVEEIDLPLALDDSQFDSALGSGGECPTIPGFTLLGNSIALSNDPFCTMADYLRPFILASAMLLALRIIFVRS